MYSSVRMLCSRSASLIRMIRMSFDIAISILRKFLGLGLLAALELDLRELRESRDQIADLFAELSADVGVGRERVLDRVVQEARPRP